MNWKLLLPSNPLLYFQAGYDGLAHDPLKDFFIYLTAGLALFFTVWVALQTRASLRRTQEYLKLARSSESKVSVMSSTLPFFVELKRHLIDIPARDGLGQTEKRRTVDAVEVFRESFFAPPFISNRLFLAIPAILTGLGVFGTFAGLQMGIGGLDLKDVKNLDKSIVPLIQGCAVAFSASVWGIGVSILFSAFEKWMESLALGRIRQLHNHIDHLFPRYVPEEAMAEMERASRGSEDLLKGLAVAIGDQMQKAISRLGSEIKDAVSHATSEGQGPLMEKSAELLSAALKSELIKLKEQIGRMSEQFSDRFNGASDELMKSVQGFQPTVEALSGTVKMAERSVTDAVVKLNAHEEVMHEMTDAAVNIRQAAEAFTTMKETFSLSSVRNEEASKAQSSAAQANGRVAEQFDQIGGRLWEVRQTLEDAARVIGSLGSPITDLKALLAGQPEMQRQLDDARSTSESARSQMLLAMSGDLAEKVGIAAQQFAQVGTLADKLAASATSLEEASSELSTFGKHVLHASKDQRSASEASREAATSNERTVKALSPLPQAITSLTDGLKSAGLSVQTGAESARDSYRELIDLQKQWFAGAELGLNGMKDRLQSLLKAYGDQVEGQTRDLMNQWTEEVTKCLQSYETQTSELHGGLDDLQSAISKLSR